MRKLIALIIACLFLCSCNYLDMKIIPAKKGETLERYVWTNEANSQYAYNHLDEDLKPVYRDLAQACLSLTEKVSTERVDKDGLALVFQAITRDYPLINWLGDTYTYSDDFSGGSTIKIVYSMNKDEANLMLAKINAHASILLEEISPELSEYEKALKVHDLLIVDVEYDLEAPHQREVYGALALKRATCQGYAKAYQFLLLRLGIDATLIYGDAGEPHAWNAVRLDNQYYYSDPTFDDKKLQSGENYLSREFSFVDQKTMDFTHTVDMEATVFPLPECNSVEHNFFVMNEAVMDTADRYAIEQLAKKLAVKAVEANDTSFQIKFTSGELLYQAKNDFIANGQLDTAINYEVTRRGTATYLGRTFEEDTNVMSFILVY